MPDSLWLRAGRPLIIGHRGASAEAPENTLAAFELALAQKADGFEFDVRLSADGVPVIIHDDTVDRTTNGTGRVADMTLAELKSLTIDGKHTIPTLDELFERFGRRVLYNVELKATGATALPSSGGPARAVADCVAAHAVGEHVLISSFNPLLVRQARRRPSLAVPVGLLRQHRMMRFAHAFAGASADHPRDDLVDASLMDWARLSQKHVHVWTVDEPARARRLAELGVHGIITNKPALIRAAIE